MNEFNNMVNPYDKGKYFQPVIQLWKPLLPFIILLLANYITHLYVLSKDWKIGSILDENFVYKSVVMHLSNIFAAILVMSFEYHVKLFVFIGIVAIRISMEAYFIKKIHLI